MPGIAGVGFNPPGASWIIDRTIPAASWIIHLTIPAPSWIIDRTIPAASWSAIRPFPAASWIIHPTSPARWRPHDHALPIVGGPTTARSPPRYSSSLPLALSREPGAAMWTSASP